MLKKIKKHCLIDAITLVIILTSCNKQISVDSKVINDSGAECKDSVHKVDCDSSHKISKRQVLLKPSNRGSPWLNVDWHRMGRDRIELARERLERSLNTKPARNVIMFLGDGMGIPTVAASRLLKAERSGLSREQIYLEWERFPYTTLARTYNTDRSTSDSAGTATAYLSGIKANMGTIGVNEKVNYGNCSSTAGNEVDSILHKSIRAGKWTGIVTTTRITHASPAGCYASTTHRDWEAAVPPDVLQGEKCQDIAHQLVNSDRNKDIRVILGGGASNLLPNTLTDPYTKKNGSRTDGKNLFEDWLKMKTSSNKRAAVVRNKTEFDTLSPDGTDYVLGLFSSSHLSYNADRNPSDEPSLAELTAKAIRLLQRSENGFFLFVEGGRIDQAHHDNIAYKALDDTLALEQAVLAAVRLTDPGETLILVTADHSHVFNFGGYAPFEESIFGFASSKDEPPLDNKPYLQLMYSNGPGYKSHRVELIDGKSVEKPRRNLTDLAELGDKNFLQDSGVWLAQETHGGEDVAVYATGPWSHLFQSTEEQTYVAHVMMYASCVGNYTKESHCSTPPQATTARNGCTTGSVACCTTVVLLSAMILIKKIII